MPYNSNNRRGGKKGFTTRLTGLFRMKSGSGYVGTLRAEDLDQLIQVIKDAKGQKKEITFFVWNPKQRGDNPALAVAVAQDRQSRGGSTGGSGSRGGSKPIEDDPFDGGGDQSDDQQGGGDDPFGLN